MTTPQPHHRLCQSGDFGRLIDISAPYNAVKVYTVPTCSHRFRFFINHVVGFLVGLMLRGGSNEEALEFSVE
jgi:hypothetical protein